MSWMGTSKLSPNSKTIKKNSKGSNKHEIIFSRKNRHLCLINTFFVRQYKLGHSMESIYQLENSSLQKANRWTTHNEWLSYMVDFLRNDLINKKNQKNCHLFTRILTKFIHSSHWWRRVFKTCPSWTQHQVACCRLYINYTISEITKLFVFNFSKLNFWMTH